MIGTDANSNLQPGSLLGRSFIRRDLEAQGASFRIVNGCEVAADYGGSDEVRRASSLGLIDLSPLPRIGFKGPNTAAWLDGLNIALPEQSNRATQVRSEVLAARLAPGEALLLGPRDGNGGAIGALERAWSYDVPGVWPVPRRDASFWFLVVGRHSMALFAKICGVDLRAKAFANGAIAQTSVARTNCIIIRSSVGDLPAYDLLGDSASSGFVLNSILDAMAEFDGTLVGFDALRAVWTAH